MTEKPFIHNGAFANAKSSFLYQEEVAQILFKILDKKGTLNIGGKTEIIYNFVKKEKKDIKKIYLTSKSNFNFPKNSSINSSKLKNFLKKKVKY